MAHILCHDVAADRGRGAAHDQGCGQLVAGKAQPDGDRKEDAAQADQLHKGAQPGGSDARQGFFDVKGGAHGKKSQRRRDPGDAFQGSIRDGRHWQLEQGPGQAGEDADQDRIGDDALCRGGQLLSVRPLQAGLLGLEHGQDDDREDVVKGHRADDHQRRHAGVAVKILDQGHAHDGRAAAVGHLNEFALDRPVPQAERKRRHQADGQQGGEKAVENVLRIPDRVEILPAQVVEHQHRQRDLEHKRVHLFHESLIKDM